MHCKQQPCEPLGIPPFLPWLVLIVTIDSVEIRTWAFAGGTHAQQAAALASPLGVLLLLLWSILIVTQLGSKHVHV